MAGVPTYLQGDTIVITRTANGGFAVLENKGDPVNTSSAFETWAALTYYLDTNYANPPA